MAYQLITGNQFDDSLTQYGDGVFETMLAVGDGIHHWCYHWQRLKNSCQRLQISLPEKQKLYQQIQAELRKQDNEFSVVKMIVSRGKGLRGYRSYPHQPCYVQLGISPYKFNTKFYQGLKVRLCQTRLSYQPLLAGMKHINRLEYVMARREAEDGQFDEGLLFNYNEELVEGLISNVFLVKNQQIITPDLSGSGVIGTMRTCLLNQLPSLGYEVKIGTVKTTDIVSADELFLTNATSGVMPVSEIPILEKNFRMTVGKMIRKKLEHPCAAY